MKLAAHAKRRSPAGQAAGDVLLFAQGAGARRPLEGRRVRLAGDTVRTRVAPAALASLRSSLFSLYAHSKGTTSVLTHAPTDCHLFQRGFPLRVLENSPPFSPTFTCRGDYLSRLDGLRGQYSLAADCASLVRHEEEPVREDLKKSD